MSANTKCTRAAGAGAPQYDSVELALCVLVCVHVLFVKATLEIALGDSVGRDMELDETRIERGRGGVTSPLLTMCNNAPPI